jgi:hypothetical protein
MQSIKITKDFTLTQDIFNQLVNLDKQGKKRREIARLLGINQGTMYALTKVMISKGAWGYTKGWKTRLKNSSINLEKSPVKDVKTKVLRTPKVEGYITINFKGVNLQIEKNSNIIINQSGIFVK